MTKVFFTYVFGPPGNPAWPMTFTDKAARTHARNVLTEGDLVFTVGTRGERTTPEHQGRVLGVYRVSNLEVNTRDYDYPPDIVSQYPCALHPIAVWKITSPDNVFTELVGSLTGKHHLQAQSKVAELDEDTAKPLLALDQQEVQPALPKTYLGRGQVAKMYSRLAPKHRGSFTGAFGDHAVWYVYTLVLQDEKKKTLAVKVGYSHAPKERETAYNGPMAQEVTGLRWHVDTKQPTASEDEAREIEQAILAKYESHRLINNGEILSGVDPLMVAAEIAKIMRSRSSG